MQLNMRHLSALAVVLAAACSGDHVKDIGVPCDLGTDAGTSQAVFNVYSNCSTGMCLKPIVAPNANMPVPNTGALCTASCSSDSDCEGVLRGANNTGDNRCKSGFACAIPFVKGPLCCQKLCVCRDFLGPSGAATPLACQGSAAATCN